MFNGRQFNCEEQIRKIKRLPNGETRAQEFKNRNGCGKKITKSPRHTFRNVNFHSCVCDNLHPYFNELLYIHSRFEKKGTLPYQDSLMEQPNKMIEVFQLLDSLYLEKREKEEKQAHKRQNQNNRKRR